MTFTKSDTKVVKGIAIILMLYHHLFAFPDRLPEGIQYVSAFSLSGETISYWIGLFGKICVALFTFMAGYGTYYSCKNKDDNRKAIYNKLKSLYILFWQVFIVFIPICMALDVPRVTKNLEALIWNFTGLQITYNGEWWFFTPFVLLTLAYPVIKRFLNRKNADFFIDVLVAFAICNMVVFVLPNIVKLPMFTRLVNSIFWVNIRRTLELLPVFLLGGSFAKHNVMNFIKNKFAGNYIYSIGAVVVMALCFYMRKKTVDLYGVYDFFYAPIITCCSVIALQGKLLKPIYSFLERIGDESTIIWLCHSFYCYYLIPELIFKAKYPVLIVSFLLAISFATAKIIKLLFKFISAAFNKIKPILNFKVAQN